VIEETIIKQISGEESPLAIAIIVLIYMNYMIFKFAREQSSLFKESMDQQIEFSTKMLKQIIDDQNQRYELHDKLVWEAIRDIRNNKN